MKFVCDFVQEVEINLIITDYCMPGITGYDLLKRVKVLLVLVFFFLGLNWVAVFSISGKFVFQKKK